MKVIFKIKEIRKEKKLTLEQLSKKTNISKTEINDIENNIKMPTVLSAILIAQGLNKEIYELYEIKW